MTAATLPTTRPDRSLVERLVREALLARTNGHAATAAPPTKIETAREKADEGQGQSNVATVDQVTRDEQAEAGAEPKAEGTAPADAVHESDTGRVTEPEGTSQTEGETPGEAVVAEEKTPEPEAPAAAEPEAPVTGEGEATQAVTPADSDKGKAKKGKAKKGKEKK